MDIKTIRQHSLLILDHALKAAAPQRAMAETIKKNGSILQINNTTHDLTNYHKIYAIGAGKAGAAMAVALEDLLGEHLTGGLVVVKERHTLPTKKIRITEAGHPIPDERSIKAGQEIINFVHQHRNPKALFIFLLSGGASSLLVAPPPGITLADKQQVTRQLLASGADIEEINTIRKHLSLIKGGGLAKELHPANAVGLVISDVIGDHLDVIGSGPLVKDKSTWSQCLKIIKRYNLTSQIPKPVQQRIEAGVNGKLADESPNETMNENHIEHHIIAGNITALHAAAAKAESLGYRSLILSSTIAGETNDIAKLHGAIAQEITASSNPLPPPCCLISGGETTVTLEKKYGTGGRNMEFALASAHSIQGLNKTVILSAGTDGTDGPTDAAGAIVDHTTIDRAKTLALDAKQALRNHNAYPFFKTLGDLITTGPTMTNVMDIHLVLVGK